MKVRELHKEYMQKEKEFFNLWSEMFYLSKKDEGLDEKKWIKFRQVTTDLFEFGNKEVQIKI